MGCGRFLLALCFTPTLLAWPADSEASVTDDAADRPTVGLVLGGGGAKGIAHVGVLQVMEELQVPVDLVVGTSMGAIAGGLYAQGSSPEELEATVVGMDWADILRDTMPREFQAPRQRSPDGGVPKQFSAGLRDGDFVFPQGLIQGQRLMGLLRELSSDAAHVTDFDTLPLPFRATAVDIETGEVLSLGEGSMAMAMRASMAIPGVIAPVEWEDRILVDGGLANNLPVDIAREMGADVVIAVDVSGEGRQAERLASPFAVVDQALFLMISQNVQRQRDSLGEHDIHIAPDVSSMDIGTADFDRAADAVALGRQAAWQVASALRSLSVDDTEWAGYQTARHQDREPSDRVDFIRLNNRSDIRDAVILSRIATEPGTRADTEQLNRDMERIHGLGHFQSVDYRRIRENGQEGIEIAVAPRSWGPRYLRFGLALEDDFDASANYRAALAYHHTELNDRGAEVRAEAEVGSQPGAEIDYWHPFTDDLRFYVNPHASAGRREINVFADGDLVGQYRVTGQEAGLALGYHLTDAIDVRLGVQAGWGDIDSRISAPDLPDSLNFTTGATYLQLELDTMDSLAMPRAGGQLTIRYDRSEPALGADIPFERISAQVVRAFSHGPNIWIASLRGGAPIGDDLPIYALYTLGGFLNLGGFQRNELSGAYIVHGQAIYLRQITGYQTLAGMPVYLGGALETGNVWDNDRSRSADDLIHSGSLLGAAETPVGTAYLGLSRSEGGRSTAYFSLGSVF